MNYAAAAVCLWLAVSLTVPKHAFAQGRMRPPAVAPQVRLGGPGGPPRLIGTPHTSVNQRGGRFHQRFFSPYQFQGWYPYGFYGNDYSADSMGGYPADTTAARAPNPADYTTEVRPAANVQMLDDSAAVGKLQVSSETSGSKTLVRLSLRGNAGGASQVAFFLADSDKAVLSAQTVRSPPFTAVFNPPPATAFTGMTAALPGGTLVTQYLPYRRPSR